MDRVEPNLEFDPLPTAGPAGQASCLADETPRLAHLRVLAKGVLTTATADTAAVCNDPGEPDYQALLDSVTDWDSFDQRSA